MQIKSREDIPYDGELNKTINTKITEEIQIFNMNNVKIILEKKLQFKGNGNKTCCNAKKCLHYKI